MRIGVDARPLSATHTGIGRYTSEILSRLIDQSNHTWYLYSHRPLDCKFSSQNAVTRTGNLKLPGVSSLYAQWVFPGACVRDSLDVFWSPRHHLPKLPPNLPSIVTIHDLVWKIVPATMMRLGKLSERLLMPRALEQAYRVIADSHSTSEDLKHYFPEVEEKLTVVHPASFFSNHFSTAETSKPFILFAGTLEPRKNLPNLLLAYCQLLEHGTTSHRLTLVGAKGWKQNNLKRLISDLGLDTQVDQLGYVTDEELANLYGRCDFLILPSLYEGFGLPLVEAMGFGKPVITSNISSMPEVAGDAGLLVDPHSPGEIAEAMKKLITDRALHRRLSENALIQSAKFSWDKAAEETLAVLESAATLR